MEEQKEQKIEKEAGAAEKNKSSEKKNTAMAMAAYVVFFIPLLTEDKNDPFVKFHIKQGITLFVAWMAAGFISLVPIIGWMIAPFLSLSIFALIVIGVDRAHKGEQKPLPLIGKYADSFKIWFLAALPQSLNPRIVNARIFCIIKMRDCRSLF